MALSLELLVEALFIDPEALLIRDLPDQFERQPVGVVEPERLGARQRLAAGRPRPLDGALHLYRGRRHRLQELELLGFDRRHGCRFDLGQLRVAPAHDLAHDGRQAVQERLLEAQLDAMAQRPPQDAPQHVAASLVAGDDTVRQQESDRSHMVGDHPEMNVMGLISAIPS